MKQARHNLGMAHRLRVEAIGRPGERTFRLIVEAEGGTASIWMEKEQLSALAISINHSIEELKPGRVTTPAEPASESASEPSFDFKAANLGLIYDERNGSFGILAYERDELEQSTPTLSWWCPKEQAETMADQAMEVVAAGRPECPLCHGPVNPDGHMCIKANGHRAMDESLSE